MAAALILAAGAAVADPDAGWRPHPHVTRGSDLALAGWARMGREVRGRTLVSHWRAPDWIGWIRCRQELGPDDRPRRGVCETPETP